jgi:Uma2 family endonuclease
MSLDAWAALPEDAPGELVDGQLVEEEVPDYVHEVVVGWLIHVLRVWLVPRGGLVGGSEAKLAVSAQRGRKPDVTAYFPGSRMPPRRGLVSVPPDLAIEVVTPTPRDARRDRVEKLEDYARFRVKSYWILDPEVKSLEVYELLKDRRYVRAVSASAGLVRSIPGCPGLELDLDALWAETERLEPGPKARKGVRTVKPRR